MRMLQKGIVALACAAAVLLLAPQTAQAAETSGDLKNGFTWSLDSEGTLTITGTGAMEDFEYDSDQSGTTAPWEAHRTKIKKVVLSEGITSVGAYAFWSCINLTEVELPTGLKTIGGYAFSNCAGLTALELPAGLETIGEKAFDRCINLTEVELPAGLESIGGWAFDACNRLTQVTLPGSLTSMGDWVFQSCTRLTTVTFEGATAPTIGGDPFHQCSNLTAIYVPEGATGYTADKGWSANIIKYPRAITVGVEGAGGTASADRSSAAEGTTVTLQAEAAEGYHFKEWQASPGTVVVQPDGTFTMPDEAVTITAVFEAHTGGAATCKERAVCAVCGEVYGELADHKFVWVTDREATAEETGSKHQECEICGYQKAAVAIPATGSSGKGSQADGSSGKGDSGKGSRTDGTSGSGTGSPQTEDQNQVALWSALLAVSVGAAAGAAAYRRRKKHMGR